MIGRKQPKSRLRKQPQMRRVASAMPLPGATMPKTAAKRKRRNSQQRIRRPLSSVGGVLLTARWISLALLVACAYALYLIGGDDRFYLNYIPVEGTSSIPPSEVVVDSGLAGQHIFAADPQEAAERIGEINGVVTATVTLHWPNQVMVRIREKAPLATWQEGDSTFWVDEDGTLSPARTATVGLLNIISEIPAATPVKAEQPAKETGSRGVTLVAGADADTDETAAEDAATDEEADGPVAQAPFVPAPVLEGALQLRALRPNIDKLYYRPSGGLSYQDGRGWRAYFGTGQDMHQKLVVYETIVDELLKRGVQPEYISVSNQNKPFYKLVP